MEKARKSFIDKLACLKPNKIEQKVLNNYGDNVIKARQNTENRKNAKKHSILKNIKRFFIALGASVGLSTLTFGAYIGGIKLDAKIGIKNDFSEERKKWDYVTITNSNIEPGYYNEHPL